MARAGRCLCGKISYTLEGNPIATAVCACSHCQRQGGSVFSENLIVMSSQRSAWGEMAAYDEMGEKGNRVFMRRCFWSSCGSPILSELMLSEGVIAVKAGTLDDRSDVKPTVEVWCVDRQAWALLPSTAVSPEREEQVMGVN